jgi:general secretion pathway protein H
MTLLEIMIVLAIIAGVVVLVIPRIGNQNNQMKAAVRRMLVLSKQLQSTARLQGASYRIAIDLKERPEDEQEYWIEKSNSSVLLPEDKNILLEEEERVRKEKEGDEEAAKNPSSEGFTPDDGILAGRQKLPRGLRFDSVELAGLDRPVDSGVVYIHYFSQGLVEEAAIHLKYGEKSSDGLHWTIAIHPLTGRADIITENVSLKEIQQQ